VTREHSCKQAGSKLLPQNFNFYFNFRPGNIENGNSRVVGHKLSLVAIEKVGWQKMDCPRCSTQSILLGNESGTNSSLDTRGSYQSSSCSSGGRHKRLVASRASHSWTRVRDVQVGSWEADVKVDIELAFGRPINSESKAK